MRNMPGFAPIQTHEGMPDLLESEDGRLRLQLLTWIEPNNGRMLWQTDVLLDGEHWNDRIFPNGWNCLYEAIGKLDTEDDAHTHYFIPAEGHLQVIRARDKAVIELPASPGRGFSFIGNLFAGRKLIVFFLGKWDVYGLEDYTLLHTHEVESGYVFDMSVSGESEITVSYYNVTDGKREEWQVHHLI